MSRDEDAPLVPIGPLIPVAGVFAAYAVDGRVCFARVHFWAPCADGAQWRLRPVMQRAGGSLAVEPDSENFLGFVEDEVIAERSRLWLRRGAMTARAAEFARAPADVLRWDLEFEPGNEER